MASILIKHIGQKNKPFNRALTANYWKNKLLSLVQGHLESFLEKLANNLIFQLDEMTVVLYDVYKDAESLSPQEAEDVYPQVQRIRKTIIKQKNRFKEIGYLRNAEVKQKFYTLTRLINHLEARTHTRKTITNDPVPTPQYIKDKMHENSQKAVANALG